MTTIEIKDVTIARIEYRQIKVCLSAGKNYVMTMSLPLTDILLASSLRQLSETITNLKSPTVAAQIVNSLVIAEVIADSKGTVKSE